MTSLKDTMIEKARDLRLLQQVAGELSYEQAKSELDALIEQCRTRSVGERIGGTLTRLWGKTDPFNDMINKASAAFLHRMMTMADGTLGQGNLSERTAQLKEIQSYNTRHFHHIAIADYTHQRLIDVRRMTPGIRTP